MPYFGEPWQLAITWTGWLLFAMVALALLTAAAAAGTALYAWATP